jgi:hypothetical protein
MKSPILFAEKQRFTQWWSILLLIGMNCFFLYGLFFQVYMGETISDIPLDDDFFIFGFVLFLAFTIFFFLQVLITTIDDDGIYIKFRSFRKEDKFYPWQDIINCDVDAYNPMTDYGGWGMLDDVYNASGNQGMLLKFKKRRNIMVGTQKPEELKKALEKAGKLKKVSF